MAPSASRPPTADEAPKALLNHRRPKSYDEASDTNIGLAAKQWQERISICGHPTPAEDPLSRAISLDSRPA
jgi:hypothetical protein